MTVRLSACQLLSMVVDEGTWERWDLSITDAPADGDYANELAEAREKTGLDESVITGSAELKGHRVALLACEFSFLGGSIGIDAARRLVSAIRRATDEGLPLLALPASGGTRMQEGTVAFLQMVNIAAAVSAHKAARLPYLVYLRHPTTGGVFASWGSLGQVTVAEPGALIGFLGPRVYEGLYGAPFPSGVQTAENLQKHGLIDAISTPQDLPHLLARILDLIAPPPPDENVNADLAPPSTTEPPTALVSSAWGAVKASRRRDRPGVREVLAVAADGMYVLNGTGHGGGHDHGLIVALVRFGGSPCVLVGQDRHQQTQDLPLGPGALRQARRGIRLAHELDLPLVTVIDTPGAALSREAEQGGMAGEIAQCIAELTALEVPTLSVLLGQGAGGAALALFPADRIIAAENGWLSPLPPEGASVIVYRDTLHGSEVSERQGIKASDLSAAGIVDAVIPEYPDAADEATEFCARIGLRIQLELTHLSTLHGRYGPAERAARFDRIGTTLSPA